MKPTLFLRIASVLTFIHAVLHTIGGVFGKPGPGAAAVAFAAMQANQFLVMGLPRTYAEFYRGMGIAMTISMTAEAIVFWQLGSLAKTTPHGFARLSLHLRLPILSLPLTRGAISSRLRLSSSS
jgi:hypothetical protein